jgi:uncharacterized protein
MSHFSFYRSLIQGGAICGGFIVLDLIWLKLLPRLDISFGTVFTSLFMLALFRGFLLLTWLGMVWLGSLYLPDLFSNATVPNLTLVLFNCVVVGLGLYAFCVEPFQLTVTSLTVPVRGLSSPKRIVQLSDLHVEYTTQRERELPQFVENLKPDMIVLTGDFANESYVNDPLAAQNLFALLGQFHAPLGTYAVNGNVEQPSWIRKPFSSLNIRLLQDEIIQIPEFGDHFFLIGLTYRNWQLDRNVLGRLMSQRKPQDFNLLLYHKPDLAYAARDEGVDLYLAGHTHGGQVRLPFYGALFANSRYGKTFEMGQYHLDSMTMNVSRGLGFTGGDAPRARFLCPPEVVVIDLVPG